MTLTDSEEPDPVAEHEVPDNTDGDMLLGLTHDEATMTLAESLLKSGRNEPERVIGDGVATMGSAVGVTDVTDARVIEMPVAK